MEILVWPVAADPAGARFIARLPRRVKARLCLLAALKDGTIKATVDANQARHDA